MNATPFGGLYVFAEFLNQIGFHHRFNDCFEKLRKVRQALPSQNIALLAGMIIAGGERLYDIGRLANDQTIGDLFDIPSTPKDTTLRDDLLWIWLKDSARAALLLDFNTCSLKNLV